MNLLNNVIAVIPEVSEPLPRAEIYDGEEPFMYCDEYPDRVGDGSKG